MLSSKSKEGVYCSRRTSVKTTFGKPSDDAAGNESDEASQKTVTRTICSTLRPSMHA